MEDWELRKHVGGPVHYDIGPHRDWKERLEGVGTLLWYESQGFWAIRLMDGREFLIHDEKNLFWFRFDEAGQGLTFVYNP
jgi:hypothetical protein